MIERFFKWLYQLVCKHQWVVTQRAYPIGEVRNGVQYHKVVSCRYKCVKCLKSKGESN